MTWTRHAADGEHRVCVDMRLPEGVSKSEMLRAIDEQIGVLKLMRGVQDILRDRPCIRALTAIRSVIAQLPGEGEEK